MLSSSDTNFLHGSNVLHELVHPWGHSDRIVVGDSYFASVPAAIRLFSVGLRFIGVIKTSTKECPMDHLGKVELKDGKGDRHGLCTVDSPSGCRLQAFVWCDRDRRCFISTCFNIQEGIEIDRTRWKQVDRTAPNALPERTQLHIRQPKSCEAHCGGCGKIDQHNRGRQAGLMIEKKIRVESFDKRVATSLFGMVAVDAKNLFQGIRRGANYNASERVFYERLSEQLIDNTYDTRNLRARRPEAKVLQEQVASLTNTVPSSEHVIGTTPTKRRKKNHPTFLLQGRCSVSYTHLTLPTNREV